MVKLSDRMKAVADLVSPGNCVADIGCDHGYLPIYLVENEIAPKAVAMDVRPGPLSAAKENIHNAGLDDKITTRLSDGLMKLERYEGESVIIAGMGGPLVIKILTQSREFLGEDSQIKEFILQPQSEQSYFRKNMRELGFICEREDMIFEDGKYYPMGRYVRGTQTEEIDFTLADEYGGLLLKQQNKVLMQYLEKEKKTLEQIEKSLANMQDGEEKEKRMKEVNEQKMRNKMARNFFN